MALCAVLISMISLPAAASVQAGKVTDVYVSSGTDGSAFQASGTRTAKPACATENLWSLENPSSDSGKALLAALLTAYSTGRDIEIHGTGTCNSMIPTRENISYIRMY